MTKSGSTRDAPDAIALALWAACLRLCFAAFQTNSVFPIVLQVSLGSPSPLRGGGLGRG